MPPTRRKSSVPSTQSQQTLAFSGRTNKVTKPTTATPSTKAKSLSKKTSPSRLTTFDVSTPESQPLESSPEEIEIPNADQGLAFRVTGSKPTLHDEVAEKARRVGDAQVKRYWRAKEEERKAPRVHQQGLTLNEKILRHFDLSSQYGPCIGVARMKRWKRANGLGLKPPIEVLAVLLREEEGKNKAAERAYVDELMSTRLVVE